MDIEIQRTPSLQKGKPGAVHILLLDDDKEVKGTVHVWPKFTDPKDKGCEFKVEINKGGLLGPMDIKVVI